MSDFILPLELLDIVFGNLQPADSVASTNLYETDSWPKAQEIRESLSACTLVSRSWYPLAHEHLFRDVVYSFQHPPDEGPVAWVDSAIDADHRWEAYAGPDDCDMHRLKHLPLKTLQMFADFLQRSPVTRAAIRKLTLSCYPCVDPRYKIYWPFVWRRSVGERDTVDPSLLASLISSLPRLESARLYDIAIFEPRDPESTPSHISVAEVQIVSRFFLLPARVICNFTTHLGDVGKYTVTSPSWHPDRLHMLDEDTLPNNFPRRIALNTPSIDISDVHDSQALLAVSKTLQRSPFVHNLRRFSVTAASLAATPGVDAVLRCCGPYLQCFKLVVNQIDEEGHGGQILDLAALSELQELAIGFEAMVAWTDDARPWMQSYLKYFTTTILTPKTNPRLQKITLCLSCEDCWLHPVDERWLRDRWGDSVLQSHISDFETHFANILHAFGFEGMHVECNTVQAMWPQSSSQVCLYHALPLIFPMLVREKLLIVDEDTSTVVSMYE